MLSLACITVYHLTPCENQPRKGGGVGVVSLLYLCPDAQHFFN
jgi:hypothetical protein